MESSSLLIDDVGPITVFQPGSVVDISELMGKARADANAVFPLGGKTMLQKGLPPERSGIGIDMRRMNKVIDYPARDMTVTVQAGLTVKALQDLLRTENQRLPIDVPRPDEATLGGIIATNQAGPHRYGFGTLRDYLIGISIINDEGNEVKGGGRVVKNVAGYDLCKLYIGSLGTLGLISQVTLKLKPCPEEHAWISIECEADAIEGWLDRFIKSRTRPVCLELVNRNAARSIFRTAALSPPSSSWNFLISFEDNRQGVRWQLEQLQSEIKDGPRTSIRTIAGSEAEALGTALAGFNAQAESVLCWKANILPSTLPEYCRRVMEVRPDIFLQAQAGNGIVTGHLTSEITLEAAQHFFQKLGGLAVSFQGNIVIERCPPSWKKTLPVWGKARGDGWLMRQVKQKLDPRRLFNPGRFVEGI